MATRRKLLIAVVAVVGLFLFFMFLSSDPPVPAYQPLDGNGTVAEPPEEPLQSRPVTSEIETDGDLVAKPPAAEPEADPEPDPLITEEVADDEPATLPLTVNVQWEDDKLPVSDLRVTVRGNDGGSISGVSDVDGRVTFDRSWVGVTEVVTENGIVVTTHADEVTIDIPAGEFVRGRVFDESGIPVPDANIWLSSGPTGDRGRVVTKADTDGYFQIQAVQWHRWVGARYRGCVPSNLVRIDEDTTGDGRLELIVNSNASCVSIRVRDQVNERLSQRAEMLLWVLRPPSEERAIGATGQQLPPPPYYLRVERGRVHFREAPLAGSLKILVATVTDTPTLTHVQLLGGHGALQHDGHYCVQKRVKIEDTRDVHVRAVDGEGEGQSVTVTLLDAHAYGSWQERLSERTVRSGLTTLRLPTTKYREPLVGFSARGLAITSTSKRWTTLRFVNRTSSPSPSSIVMTIHSLAGACVSRATARSGCSKATPAG